MVDVYVGVWGGAVPGILVISIFIYMRRRKKKKKYRERNAESEPDCRGPLVPMEEVITPPTAAYQELSSFDSQDLSPYQSLVPISKLEISRKYLTVENSIGEGSFGKVCLASVSGTHLRIQEGKMVAVKKLKENATETDRKSFLEELNVMKGLPPHNNVITLLGCVTKSEPMYILVEYAPYGDLCGYLRARAQPDAVYENRPNEQALVISSKRLRSFAHDIACGMEFLAMHKIIHRDLAARNVLVVHNGRRKACKVTDFGLSKNIAKSGIYTKLTAGRLPVRWMALESLDYGQYTTQSDVWSFGIALYEIFTRGGTPYKDMTNMQVVKKLRAGYRLPKPEGFESDVYNIMLQCWSTSPAERPSFTELKNSFIDTDTREAKPLNPQRGLYEEV